MWVVAYLPEAERERAALPKSKENRGHEMYYSKNWWANSEYKGVNTRWVTAEGQRFEVQFHTRRQLRMPSTR